MSKTLFISDLHLDRERPEIIRLFADFLITQAPEADALYILGDLFEYWIGDDQSITGLEIIIEQLHTLTSQTPVFFQHGNRDFLVGETFAKQTGILLLPETQMVDLYGQSALLMHGDSLCTDDIEYQKLRVMLRNNQWQTQFLSLAMDERVKQAMALRDQSVSETGAKSEDIMDVNQQSVEAALKQHQTDLLIHGHTHRPAQHAFVL
ncbi:MAG TPA: UDP-2,3-diacylglucosamine diphosphatase, partial [Gammaproteobacteria bacterium]|nr:UDP-2,3-diacylglucosamine diphosphatase [Gammaproteobacteria bacterium]